MSTQVCSFFRGSPAGLGRAASRAGVKDRPEADRGVTAERPKVLDAGPVRRMLAPAEKT